MTFAAAFRLAGFLFLLLLPPAALAPHARREGTAGEAALLSAAPAFFGLVALPFIYAQTAGWLAPLHRALAAHELLPWRVPVLLLLHLYTAFCYFVFVAVGPRRGFGRALRLFPDALFTFLYYFLGPCATALAADLAHQALRAGAHPSLAALSLFLLPPLAVSLLLHPAVRLAAPMRRRPDLEAEASPLFAEAGASLTSVHEIAFRTPFHNGFSFGNRWVGHRVALTAASADGFTPEERRAVFAHEAGHAARGDLDRQAAAAAVGGGATFALLLALASGGALGESGAFGSVTLALLLTAGAGALLARGRADAELHADRFAAERGLAAPLLSALGKIWGVGPITRETLPALSPEHRRRAILLLAIEK